MTKALFSGEQPSAMRVLCSVEPELPEAYLRTLVHDLIFAYLGSLDFKLAFSLEYARAYSSILRLGTKKKQNLQGWSWKEKNGFSLTLPKYAEFSVQILTNSVVCDMLMKEQPQMLLDLFAYVTDIVKR